MKTKWFEGEVTSVTRISETKMLFTMRVETDDLFNFHAGQFITMDLPLGEKRRQRWRSYSIANIPNDRNELEFGIGYLDEGLASKYFFSDLQTGDKIKFKGPEGNFVLPQNMDRPIIMIATGTGVIPFIGMMREIVKNDIPFKSIHLIYGTRYSKDILFKSELESYVAQLENFQVDIVLSRESDWAGAKGYVHDIYKNKYTTKDSEALFLLCGWSSMVDEAVLNIFPIVSDPIGQIKYELYG